MNDTNQSIGTPLETHWSDENLQHIEIIGAVQDDGSEWFELLGSSGARWYLTAYSNSFWRKWESLA